MSILEQFSSNPKTSCLISERPIESKQFDWNIIVPAYKVEQYIGECLNSVLPCTVFPLNLLIITIVIIAAAVIVYLADHVIQKGIDRIFHHSNRK